MAAGSGFYWEYDRLKSNLLLHSCPALLNDSPPWSRWSCEGSEEPGCRADPVPERAHTRTNAHKKPPLLSPSLGHSLVGAWKATRQKHPGSPCWSDRKARLCSSIQCIGESWHIEARGQVKVNGNRMPQSTNSDEA